MHVRDSEHYRYTANMYKISDNQEEEKRGPSPSSLLSRLSGRSSGRPRNLRLRRRRQIRGLARLPIPSSLAFCKNIFFFISVFNVKCLFR